MIAATAVDSLLRELETWPKPGLVSHIDSGSHHDMNADAFRASATVLEPYFERLADAGSRGCGMMCLRSIGIEAEAAMLAVTAGVNTHRGAIFGLGLLCAAAGARASGRVDAACSLGATVSRLWADTILDGPLNRGSHGAVVHRRFGAGGARVEAANGFPSIYETALPALKRGMRCVPDDAEAARVEACFALIATVEDTNLLYRGGRSGLRFAQRTARDFLEMGGVTRPNWRRHAQTVHESFVLRRLSPGGSADLLAMTLFVDACEGA